MKCPRCKGAKELKIHPVKMGVAQKQTAELLTCPTCSGSGYASDDQAEVYRQYVASTNFCWCRCPPEEREGTHQTDVNYHGRTTRMWICRKCGKPMPGWKPQSWW